MPKKKRAAPSVKAYSILALGILAVSLAAILIRYAQGENVPSLLIAAARLTIATVILSPLTLRRYRSHLRGLTRRELGLALLAGTALAAHFAAWVTSLALTSVLVSVVLVTTSSLWVGILEVTFLKVRLSRPIVIGLVVALLGGIIIGLPGADSTFSSGGSLQGSILALVGAMAVAVYLVIGRRLREKLPVMPYIWLVYGCAAGILICAVIVTQTPVTGYSAAGYAWLLALGLIPQLIGHSSLNYALGYLPATYISLATQLEPIGSAIFAFFLFGEVPALQQVAGSAVVLAGVFWASAGDLVRARLANGRTA